MKKTYGQIAAEHFAKPIDDDVIEYRRAMEPAIVAKLNETAFTASQQDLYKNRDFYIVLLTKVERLGHGVRTLIFARRSCPTPTYKQSVWKYRHVSGTLEFLWTIPDAVLYWHIIRNQSKFLADPETQSLAQFVVLMESGQLLDWCKQENGEKTDAVIILKENVCQTN